MGINIVNKFLKRRLVTICILFSGVIPARIVYAGTEHSKEEKISSSKLNFRTTRQAVQYCAAYDSTLTLWNVPFKEKDIKTSFGKTHVLIAGDRTAAPLILLHGINASSTMWYPNVEDLASQYCIYAIDFLNEPGKSARIRSLGDKKLIAEWYLEVFDSLGLDTVSVIGASRGGWLSLLLALESKRIAKIVLLSPAQAFKNIKIKTSILPLALFYLRPEKRLMKKVMNKLSASPGNIHPLWKKQFYLANKTGKRKTGAMKMTLFSDKELASLNIPVLLLTGDKDIFNDTESNEHAQKLIPSAKVEMIKNAGHFVSFDQPSIVNKAILDFLKNETPYSDAGSK